jgi:hypothetical protein
MLTEIVSTTFYCAINSKKDAYDIFSVDDRWPLTTDGAQRLPGFLSVIKGNG